MQINKAELLAIAPLEDRFSPAEECWHIPFSLITTGTKASVASLTGIKIKGEPLPRDKVRFLEGSFRGMPVMAAGRYLLPEELADWQHTRLLMERGRKASRMAMGRLSAYNSKISLLAEKVPPLQKGANEMILPASLVDFEKDESFFMEVLFSDRLKNTCGFNLRFTVTTLPGYPASRRWVGGDLHIHSLYSDGRRTLSQLKSLMKGRGYHYIYLSDGHHTKRLLAEDWQGYCREVYKNSDRELSMFPGVETAVGSGDDEKGHLLAFGTNKSIAGLEEHTKSPQDMINAARKNEPSAPSFAAITHPLGIYRWRDFSVFGHRGMEIMSGALQFTFGLSNGPSRLWRKEIKRHMDQAFLKNNFPAPYTATDWHGYWFEPLRSYVTWTCLSSNWDELDYRGRKGAVDRALFAGQVVASRRGSLGFFRVGDRGVGSIIRDVPAGTQLPLYVEYRAAQRGLIHLYVMRGNVQEISFRRSGIYYPGQVVDWQDTLTFPGGRQLYWLYAAGSDYIYSSPIFISEN